MTTSHRNPSSPVAPSIWGRAAIALRGDGGLESAAAALGVAGAIAGFVLYFFGRGDLAVILLAAGLGAMLLSAIRRFWQKYQQVTPHRAADADPFHDLFERNPAGIFLFTSAGTLWTWNKRAGTMIVNAGVALDAGMTYAEFCSRLAGAGNIPATRSDPEAWIASRMREFGNVEEQQELKFANGGWTRVSQRRLTNGDIAVIVIDTTAERQRELAIRVQEKFYRELAELTSDWLWQSDTEHRYVELDPSIAASWSSPFQNIAGRRRIDYAAPEDRAQDAEKWRRYQDDLDNRRAFRDLEYDVDSALHSATRRIRTSGTPQFDDNGNFLGYLGVARDVTAEYEHRRQADIANQRLAGALEAIPVAVGIYNHDDILQQCNASLRDMLEPLAEQLEPGTPRSEIIQAGIDKGLRQVRIDPETGIDGAGRLLLNGERPWEVQTPDGRCFILSQQRLQSGDLIVTGIDVSELKRQTWELAEKSSILQGTLENIQQGLAVFAPDFRLIAWNERFLSLLGLAEIELTVGTPMQAIATKIKEVDGRPAFRSQAEIEKVCQRAMACNPPQLIVDSADGLVLDVRRSRMPDGGVALTLTDITEQKHRERDLERKTSQLEVVYQSMEYGITVVDSDGTISAINDQMKMLLELPDLQDASYIGLKLPQMVRILAGKGYYGTPVPEDQLDAFVADQARDMLPAEPLSRERRLNSGSVLDYRVSPIGPSGWLITCRDITQQRRNEEALREAKEQAELANRAKSEFLANTSHELRTPLNAIIGFSEILKNEMFGPLGSSRYIDYVTDINNSGQHLLDIINDLLDLAKVESGHLELNEEPTVVKALVEGALRLVRERAETNRIELHTNLSDCLASILVDQRAIKQVLINLLSNAVKFTPEGGSVSVSTAAAKDGSIEFKVIDTGIGMAPEDISKALAPFGQIDGSMARRYHGTGLGLPLASRLVELHGGNLEVLSKPGAGTTIVVRLPASRHVQHVGRQLAAIS